MPPPASLGKTMENILAKLAQRAKVLLRADNSIVEQPQLPRSSSKSLEARRKKMSVNKEMFAEIFGEEAPSWWGNFSTVKL